MRDECAKEASPRLGGACGTSPARGLRGSDAELQMQCAQECASEAFSNPRHLIGRLIDYHNRQSVQLHALLRALPAEMNYEAERALYDLAKTALGSIR